MSASQLARVFVSSEVEELQAILLHTPGEAHRNILPEHVEAHLALKDFAARRLRIAEEDLDSLALSDGSGQSVELTHPANLTLRFRTKDGKSGEVAIGGALESLFVENPQYILFDDIVDADRIRQEHDDMRRVIASVAPATLSVSEMALDALHQLHLDKQAEGEFFSRLERFSEPEERPNIQRCRRYFHDEGSRRFLQLLLTGRDHHGRYVMHPLPNLLFSRDLAAVVGNTVILSSAAKPARWRESVLAWLIFTHHPIFADLLKSGQMRAVDMLAARAESQRPADIHIEGGDILHLDRGILLVGVGERTTMAGLMEMAARLWADDGAAKSGIQRIIAVEILAKRASMHLDTIFTLAHQDGHELETMVFGPYMHDGGYGEITAYELIPDLFRDGHRPDLANLKCWQHRSLDTLLDEAAGFFMRTMMCGGKTRVGPNSGNTVMRRPDEIPTPWEDPEQVFFGRLPNAIGAKREQWTDGANLFALAPGIVLTYGRNYRSLAEMGNNGYRVVLPDEFVLNSAYYLKRCRGRDGLRIVIPIGGSELSRGRGGPRCMTLPLHRERTNRT